MVQLHIEMYQQAGTGLETFMKHKSPLCSCHRVVLITLSWFWGSSVTKLNIWFSYWKKDSWNWNILLIWISEDISEIWEICLCLCLKTCLGYTNRCVYLLLSVGHVYPRPKTRLQTEILWPHWHSTQYMMITTAVVASFCRLRYAMRVILASMYVRWELTYRVFGKHWVIVPPLYVFFYISTLLCFHFISTFVHLYFFVFMFSIFHAQIHNCSQHRCNYRQWGRILYIGLFLCF